MKNYYEILGVNSSATIEEIRRAYRVLARRYHPDVNPGKQTADKFRQISEAYEVLSDPVKRNHFDTELGGQPFSGRLKGYGKTAFERAEAGTRSARERYHRAKFGAFKPEPQPVPEPPPQKPQPRKEAGGFGQFLSAAAGALRDFYSERKAEKERQAARESAAARGTKVSIVEVSVLMRDAILGVKKTVEFAEPEGPRKISIKIPAGVRSGTVLRMRQKQGANEELVIIVKVARHPFMTIQQKGLMVEVPVSMTEAISGTTLTLPTIDGTARVSIPPGSQSGSEIRLQQQGIRLPDGTREDLFYRLMVQVPTCFQAVGIKEKAGELDRYYESPVRQGFPSTLLEA